MSNQKSQMLIVGGTGFLGSYLLHCESLKEKYHMTGASRSSSLKLDLGVDSSLTELREYLLTKRPEFIVITAGVADVEACAKDPVGTRKINVDGVKRVLEMATRFSVKPIFFSSDYALRPVDELYYMSEESECLPQTEYGRQKLEVEKWMAENFHSYLIFRTSKLISMNTHPKNLLFQIVQDVKSKKSVAAVYDQWFTPVFIEDIGQILSHEKISSLSGIFHLSSKSVHTRYDLALKVREMLGLAGECDIKPISKTSFNTLEDRPRFNTLSADKICGTLDFELMEIENSSFWRSL